MKKLLSKFYKGIDKIGKQNFILIVFALIVIIISGLYQTFSLYTTTDQAGYLEGLKTYKFILNTSTTYSVTIAADSVKNVALTITNPEPTNLKYGICYTATATNNLYIGTLESSDYPSQGIIAKNSSYVVSMMLENRSSSDVTINFRVAYGLENGGDLEKTAGENWVDQTSNTFLLSTVTPGSYVSYVGNNGCSGDACSGATTTCDGSTSSLSGWRVVYVKNNSAYLVSAGVPECVRTYVDYRKATTDTTDLNTAYYYGSGYTFDDTTGTFTLTGVTSSTLAWRSNYTSIISNTPYTCKKTTSTGTCDVLYEIFSYVNSTQGTIYTHYNYDGPGSEKHIENLDNKALTYCNATYAYDGACTSSSTWAMDGVDFLQVTGREASSCYYQNRNIECGYGNNLIDIGGGYWFATALTDGIGSLSWDPNQKLILSTNTSYNNGMRPIIRLASSVVVTGGSGTSTDPYRISNT